MKVVHLTPYFVPAWSFGGVVQAVYGLTTALAALGHEVTVLTTDLGDGGVRLPEGETEIDGVRVVRCRNLLPGLRRLSLSSPVGMRAAAQEVLAGADVLHVHELRSVENLRVLPVAQRAGVKTVLSPHGTLRYNTGRGALKRLWDGVFGARLAQGIDHVAALTEAEAADVRMLWQSLGINIAPERLSIVPNGVDPAVFAVLPPRDIFRARWQVPEDVPLMLYLGRLHERKGVHHLVAALPHLPEVWLAIVGPDEGQGAALRAQAEKLGTADRVVFTGLLTGDDKLAAFGAADVLALPAVGEGLPLVVLEALAAGLPVAISDECHLPEVITTRAGVRLYPLHDEVIAAAVQPLLNDATLRAKFGERGRKLVEDRFTWSAVAAQMVDLYWREVKYG